MLKRLLLVFNGDENVFEVFDAVRECDNEVIEEGKFGFWVECRELKEEFVGLYVFD